MFLKRTVLPICIVFFIYVSALWAGDSAVFVDLGFSQDGKTYMFGQYGVLSQSLKPWADLFVVDMITNNFVPNGRLSNTQNNPIKAGQDGSGILYQMLTNNSNLTNRYRIDFQNQGQPLYIARNENPSENGETIDFRDFINGKSYRAQLIPTITGSGINAKSSFYINLDTRSPNGQTSRYKVGTPEKVRQRITSYNFKKVLIDSTGNSVIFVIEMKQAAEGGHDIRYMVEAVRF
jgi:predicted secreted protein